MSMAGKTNWAAVLPNGEGLHIAVATPTGPEPRTELKAGEYRLLTAVPAEHVWLQVLELPTGDWPEAQQMVDLQLDNLTPLPVEEVVHSVELLEQSATTTRVLLAIARKEFVNERLGTLEAAGLAAEVVGVDALAAFRGALRTGRLPKNERLNLAVQRTATAAHVILFTDGVPRFFRSLPGEADETELRRTLLAAQVEWPTRPVGEVIELTGNASPVAELCADAAAREPVLNLLPDEWRQRRRSARQRQVLTMAGIGLGALYVVALVAALVLLAWRQSQVAQQAVAISRLKPAHAAARQLQSTLTAMQAQLDQKYSALEVLREVSQLQPDQLKLSGFGFKKDQSVSLRGQATSAINANEFISRLEKCPLFSAVKTVSVRTEGGLTKFEVVCTLASAGVGSATKGTAWR